MTANETDLQVAVAASPHDLENMRVTQPFKLNNVALKWIRDTHEDPPGNPTTDRVDLTSSDPLQIGVIVRSGGMDYAFHATETTPWSWRQMLAAMSPAAKSLILGANSLSVVRVTCEPVIGSYDHKRWHAARHLGRPYSEDASVPVWDFFVTRSDGTTVRFHTNYSNNKVSVASVHEPPEWAQPPKKGKGMSDGPGTYKRVTFPNYTFTVHCRQDGCGDGGGGSAVAEARLGLDTVPTNDQATPPPGFQNTACDQGDTWQRDQTDDTRTDWRGWRSWRQDPSSGSQDWGSGWQDRWDSGWQDQGWKWQEGGGGCIDATRQWQ